MMLANLRPHIEAIVDERIAHGMSNGVTAIQNSVNATTTT